MSNAELAIDERFELGERVGKGAFGEVLRAIDRTTEQPVAIKRLLEHRDDPLIVDRFEREARLLQRIDSPHVVRFIAFGADRRGRPCIVLEWLDGCDLARLARKGRLPLQNAIDIVQQAALGLHALHDRGIVHRDIKPANFFVLPKDPAHDHYQVKLLDLGIARSHSDATVTAFGTRIGTPSYMSPEQARGEDGLTTASDIFSLGVVLYELLAGVRPFAGDQSLIVLAKIVLHEPAPLSDIRPDVPADLAMLVARAMAKSPAQRFESAMAMAHALTSVAVPDPTSSKPLSLRPGPPTDADDAPTTVLSTSLSATREQRVVTAVFAGLLGAPEPARAMVTFQFMALEAGASCYPTLGRQMIAVFGGVRSTGDEALRGARLALLAAERIEGVQLRVATARAHVGDAGLSAEAIERGCVARIPQGPRAIVLDAPTARLVASQLWVEELDDTYILRGERSAIPAAGPLLLGRETRMVGRDRELAMLEALYDECVSEPVARVVLVSGAAGSGKSRLRYELVQRLVARDDKPTVLMSRGESPRAGSPFGMIADAIRRAAQIVDGEPPRAQERKLLHRIRQVVPAEDLVRIGEFLGELASIPTGHVESPALRAARHDPIIMGDAKRLAFEDWILAECSAAPVVLVLEDLHWGDLPTIKLIGSILETARDRPLMVIALARPEVQETFPDLWHDRELQHCRLGALTRSASERLVRDVLGDSVDTPAIRLIAERADGNPFFLEELIRAVAEGQSELPASVLGMVQARLDALGSDCKRVLRAASIFGERFHSAGVVALCGGDPASSPVTSALNELTAREVLHRRPATFPGKAELVFRHALIREAAYAMLPINDRVIGHRLAAEWLETIGETDAMSLANHYERGGQPQRAVIWYQRAAEQAFEGNDLKAASDRADRGIGCGAEGNTLGMLRLVQAEASRWGGDTDNAIRFGTEAAALLPRGDRTWFRAITEILAALGRRGAWDDLETYVRQAADTEALPSAASTQIACLCPGASQLIQAGRYDAADEITSRIHQLAVQAGELEAVALARLAQLRGSRAVRESDLENARQGYFDGMTLFESAGDLRNTAIERLNLAFACAQLGELEEAEKLLRQCMATSERMRLHNVHAYCLLNLGRVLIDLDQFEDALQIESRASDMGLASHSPRLVGAAQTHLATLAYRVGDFAGAEQLASMAQEVLTIAPALRAGALATRARALIALDRPKDAVDAATEATTLLELGHHDMFDTLVRLTYAEALEASGDKALARQALSLARLELLRMADRITDDQRRTNYLTRVDANRRTLALVETWGLADEEP